MSRWYQVRCVDEFSIPQILDLDHREQDGRKNSQSFDVRAVFETYAAAYLIRLDSFSLHRGAAGGFNFFSRFAGNPDVVALVRPECSSNPRPAKTKEEKVKEKKIDQKAPRAE